VLEVEASLFPMEIEMFLVYVKKRIMSLQLQHLFLSFQFCPSDLKLFFNL
jgi:hypothetical protein